MTDDPIFSKNALIQLKTAILLYLSSLERKHFVKLKETTVLLSYQDIWKNFNAPNNLTLSIPAGGGEEAEPSQAGFSLFCAATVSSRKLKLFDF